MDQTRILLTHNKHSVGNLMLAYSASKDDHACLLCCTGEFVEAPNVFDDVDNKAWVAEGVEVDHVAQRAVREGRTEDWNVILHFPLHKEPGCGCRNAPCMPNSRPILHC